METNHWKDVQQHEEFVVSCPLTTSACAKEVEFGQLNCFLWQIYDNPRCLQVQHSMCIGRDLGSVSDHADLLWRKRVAVIPPMRNSQIHKH